MFGYNTITAVLFRFINSAILFGVGWYVYKKYAQETLEEQVDEKLAFISGLKQQKNALAAKENQLLTTSEKQKQECAMLKQKVLDWHAFVDQKIEKREEEKKYITQMARKRTDQQNKYLLQETLLQEALPQALAKAYTKLEKDFLDSKKNKQYMNTIITQLEKGK